MSVHIDRDPEAEVLTTLETIVGTAGVRPRSEMVPPLQDRILAAIAPGSAPHCTVFPATAAELGEVVACAHRNHWAILPLGSGSKLSWGSLARDIHIAISTARINRLIDHAGSDLTLTAAAGMSFREAQALLASHQQHLGIDPPYPNDATLGGIIATASTGSLRQSYGSVRDKLLGLSFVRSDGQLVKAGGRVVKNVAGYDLMKLFTGSYGTLGIVTQATFRLFPFPPASRSLLCWGEAESISRMAQQLRRSTLTPAAADLLSPHLVRDLTGHAALGLLLRFQSIPESVSDQTARAETLARSHDLAATLFESDGEADLWRSLRQAANIETVPTDDTLVTAKLGILPTEAVGAIGRAEELAVMPIHIMVHANSGIGWLCGNVEALTADVLAELRTYCGDRSGYLSVLQAPPSLKQGFDTWGYAESDLSLMGAIARQFDPRHLLSPHRLGNLT